MNLVKGRLVSLENRRRDVMSLNQPRGMSAKMAANGIRTHAQPKSFWDIWDLSDSLSSREALNFQWVPGHAELPRNERADSLVKTGATLTLPMFPVHWHRPLQRLYTIATLCGDEIFLTTPSPTRFLRFPRRNWPFPISTAVNCLDFAATVIAFS